MEYCVITFKLAAETTLVIGFCVSLFFEVCVCHSTANFGQNQVIQVVRAAESNVACETNLFFSEAVLHGKKRTFAPILGSFSTTFRSCKTYT